MDSIVLPAPALPVVVIGAGPVGLAAAVHLRARGFEPLVLEAGDGPGAAMRQWAHVRMFSPWEYNVDRLAAELLARHGWTLPDPQRYPTGGELVAQYLEPLAATPELAPSIRTGARVVAIAKQRRDLMKHAPPSRTICAVSGGSGDSSPKKDTASGLVWSVKPAMTITVLSSSPGQSVVAGPTVEPGVGFQSGTTLARVRRC